MEDKNYFTTVLNIIDMSIKRGAWTGEDIEAVAVIRKETLEKIKNLVLEEKKEEEKITPISKQKTIEKK
jgi:hypothetical protein